LGRHVNASLGWGPVGELEPHLAELVVIGALGFIDDMERLQRVRLLDQRLDLLLDGDSILPFLRHDERSRDEHDPETHRSTSLEGAGFYCPLPLTRGSPPSASRSTVPRRARAPSRARRSTLSPSSVRREAPA